MGGHPRIAIGFSNYVCTLSAYLPTQSAEDSKNIIKSYLADLASSITNGNVELAEQAIYIYREFLQDPISFAVNHFNYSDIKDLKKKVWESQLKCIFPHLERYRSNFVERYEKEIEPLLNTLTDPFGNTYMSVSDIELGTLAFMARKRMLHMDSAEYEVLKTYANARNDLAHINVLSYDVIKGIIKGYDDRV